MVRKIVDKPFTDDGLHYAEFAGLSTDSKPTTGIITGSKFTEVDTGDEYLFAESDNPAWTKVGSGDVTPSDP